MDRYRLKIIALTALVCLTGSSCTDDENNGQGNNIIYGENIIGNGEQTFEIKDHQYLKRGHLPDEGMVLRHLRFDADH